MQCWRRWIAVLGAALLSGSLAVTPIQVWACSCPWLGPFFQVAPQAPLILIGDIVRHEAGPPPALVVWVREVLKGGLLDSGMRVQIHPNPREIEGWQFLSDPRACAARPYQAEQGPGERRSFIFSPAVGQDIAELAGARAGQPG